MSFYGPSVSSSEEFTSCKEEKTTSQKKFGARIAQIFSKSVEATANSENKIVDDLEPPETIGSEVSDDHSDDSSLPTDFAELMKTMESKDLGSETPSNLPGGILLDQSYMISPQELNSLLFSPDASFLRSLADAQGSTELQIGAWKFENAGESLKRMVTYIKAATKLLKAVKAFEEQSYVKADGKNFAVLVSVSTPDVMYGGTFKTELLYCILPGPEMPSGEQTSHLTISWRMNFLQSTMMKGMIENGARQGLKDSFEVYASVLLQNIKPVDMKELGSTKEQVLASLQAETQSDWKLAVQYFANFTVVSTVVIGLYVFIHIWLCPPSIIQGLEFVGLDLPDSIGEVIVCGVLVLQFERVLLLISRFMQARAQKGKLYSMFCFSTN